MSDFQTNPRWPHVLGIDSGTDHPTAAVMATVSPSGVYFLLDFYCESMKTMRYHATAMMAMIRRWKQLGKRDFIAIMADHRDKQFPMELAAHTNQKLYPGLWKPRDHGMTRNVMRLGAIRKIESLLIARKFIINRESEYYDRYVQQWGSYRWDPNAKDMPRPVKTEDDLLDGAFAAIDTLYPTKREDLDYSDYEGRIDKELPIPVYLKQMRSANE